MNVLNQSTVARRVTLAVLGSAFVLSAAAIVAFNALIPPQGVTLAVGQVASTDILAPRSLTYQSDVLTRLARQAADAAILPIYDPPDPSVLRQQIQLGRHVLDYINDVRHDSYANPNQQIADLAAIDSLHVDSAQYLDMLDVSDDAWKDIDTQTMSILERAMRNEIRENSLPDVYANLPNLVNFNTNETQAALIVALTQNLIKPNVFYNEERTLDARKTASAAVAPETRNFIQGQVVVRAGSVVSEADLEALTNLNLLQPADHRFQVFTGTLLAVLVLSALGTGYILRFHSNLTHDLGRMGLVAVIFLLFLAGARIFGATDDFRSRLYPVAAFALVMVTVTESQVAIILTGGLAALIGLVAGSSLEFTLLVAISGTAGILSLKRNDRVNGYLVAGLIIGLVNVLIGLLFLMLQGITDPARVATVLVAGLLNGAISAGLGIVGLHLVSTLLNLPTNVHLLDLSQPSQPLLQRLLREAPGTYQHSLQVANLAELAAEQIGIDPLLMRVAALYHDVGKMIAPHYFVENQADGVNPHDTLNDPLHSAQIIISHVTEGEKLARQYRLPQVLIDFIMQHHGTMPVLYFYNRALEACGCDESQVDRKIFQYPGPCPQCPEAALLMLADTSESIIRAKRPRNKQEIEKIIHEIIAGRLADGQLDSSHLTVNDLKVIQTVFVSTLQGVFHPRILYPPLSTQEMKVVSPTGPLSSAPTGEFHL